MRIIHKTKLMDKRNYLIFACWKEGFILDEIAAMFKLDKARISQIVKQEKGRKVKTK